MYEAKRMLFIYVETPLHAGSGRGLGPVDLPIQRERVTGYPTVQASSLKGRLRAVVREAKQWYDEKDEHPRLTAIFGKAGGEGENYAGALVPGDARLLLFPVRSLAGVFAWTTSLDALSRFARDAKLVGMVPGWQELASGPVGDAAWVAGGSSLIAGKSVVLEDYSFTPEQKDVVAQIGAWLADNALPETGYDYWKSELRKKLVILPEDAFSDFAQHGTEVQTHVRLDPKTKTVQTGALWTVESLPTDTLLYAPLLATRSRQNGTDLSAEQVLETLAECDLSRTQLGGDETTGQGWVALRLSAGGAK